MVEYDCGMREWWRAGDEELLLELGAAQRAMTETFAGMLPVLAEVASRDLATERGIGTWRICRGTRRTCRVRWRGPGCGPRRTWSRRTVGGEPTWIVLPVLAAAVREAAVSAEHVRVIQAVLAAIPPHLEEHRPSLEADLTQHSRTLDPDAVAKLGKAALALLDPDGPRPREPRPTRNRLTLRASGEGSRRGAGSIGSPRQRCVPCCPPWVPGGPRFNPVHRPDLVGAVPAPRPPTRVVNLEFSPA